jgi:hypothetical protein
LIVSRDLIGLLEAHSQVGMNIALNDIDRTEARYAVGLTGQPWDFLALTIDFLGRSELKKQGSIPGTGRLPAVKDGEYVQSYPELVKEYDGDGSFTGRPYFIDLHRNDILELAVGLKVEVAKHALMFANFLVPLNNDGLRADFVPTIGIEASF